MYKRQIEGGPATFEFTRPEAEETTYAEAGRLRYDLSTGTVEFSENAIITEGGNQISSSYLMYNIAEQRISAQSSGPGDERVKITVVPEVIEEGLEDEDRQQAEEALQEAGQQLPTGEETQ